MKKTMSTIDGELFVGIVLFLASLLGIASLLRLPSVGSGIETPIFIPFVFLLSLAMLSLLLVIQRWVQGARPVRSGILAQIWKSEKFRQVALIVIAIAIYIYALIPLIGFYMGSLLFLFGTATFFGGHINVSKVFKSAATAVGTVLSLYLIFAVMFKLPFR